MSGDIHARLRAADADVEKHRRALEDGPHQPGADLQPLRTALANAISRREHLLAEHGGPTSVEARRLRGIG